MAGFCECTNEHSGFITGDTMKNSLLNIHFCDFSDFDFVVGYFATNWAQI
jgi:hypothetical protein